MTKSIPLLVTLYILLGFVVLSTLAMPTYTAAQSHARIVVNTLSDTEANDFWCTLREAIKAANSNAAYWGCGYSPSPDLRMDTILFAESLNGVIELSSALPVNQDRLEIFSVPHRIAIDGKGSHRVFTNRGTLRLVGLKIQNGQSSTQGGAIYNESGGKLELIETTFQANRANQGGAIYNLGNVIIQRSTFLQNQSTGKGGAIANVQQGSVNIANSTFYQNEATQGGGGLWNKNSGAFLENVTFWENRGTPGTALLSEIG
ncbi:MAG: CSLREA domain-containing protein, partial [Anaerolineales bacterium]|nr:CSLREA domain-containing protein [Anaerolineales bacterium]MDW8448268.1 CSLREA domain-containing protein [Anaerolineales bacterium]